ncbi:MAG: DUF6754 domain-containing protein [Candidatus Promineifilaceae bacterium]
MDILTTVLTLVITAASLALLLWLTGRAREQPDIVLRPLPAYAQLSKQIGRAVENGQGVHVALGQASLAQSANPVAAASLVALDHVAAEACAHDVPPLVTVGDGTLLLAAQDSLRGAYAAAGRPGDYRPELARFVAPNSRPAAFAAGTSAIVGRADVGGNVMLGRFGPEWLLIAAAADRKGMEQIAASDDPLALAAIWPQVGQLLIGEELLASAAYLRPEPAGIASAQVQDILRWLAVAGLLLAAFYNLLVGR